MDTARLESIHKLIGEFRMANPMSELAVGAVSPDETWVSQNAPGLRYEIGSITKVFTAILVAEAVLQRRVSLEDQAWKHLGVPLPASIASLLTHTSGLPRLPLSMVFTGEVFRRQPYAHWSRNRLRLSLSLAPFAKGGAGYRYSNLGFAALGLVLERVHGCRYEGIVQEWLNRHRLTSSSLKEAPELELQGKTASGQPIGFWRMAAFAPAGGIRSTIGDMLEFTKICLGNEESVLLTQEPRPEAKQMALGWHILRKEGLDEITCHNGGTAACRSFLGLSHNSGIGVVVLNNTPASVDALGIELLKSMLQRERAPLP